MLIPIKVWIRVSHCDFLFIHSYTATENFHPYPDPVKNGTVLVVIDETMSIGDFQESLTKKPLSKEEKQKLKSKLRMEKRKIKAKIKNQKMKEAKRRKKLRDLGIFDVGYTLSTSKPIGMWITLNK